MLKKSLLALVAGLSLVLSGCAPADSGGPDGNNSGQFPVTINHAFGETVIESAPQRVVTWGWGSADAALALGVVPVGIPAQFYGGDEKGLLPWIKEDLDAKGVEVPTLLVETDGVPPYEAIAALQPDLILAPYSGITQEQYQLLAQIAPVVAYPELPWATDWQDVIKISGAALGRTEAANKLLQDIADAIAAKAAEHPEFKGKTIAQVWDVGGTVYVYKQADARVGFVEDLGFVSAPSVETLAGGDSAFYYTISTELLDELQSDVLLVYGTDQSEIDAFLNAPYAKLMSQVKEGRVATLAGATIIASVSPPTALSLTWGIDQFVSALQGAIK